MYILQTSPVSVICSLSTRILLRRQKYVLKSNRASLSVVVDARGPIQSKIQTARSVIVFFSFSLQPHSGHSRASNRGPRGRQPLLYLPHSSRHVLANTLLRHGHPAPLHSPPHHPYNTVQCDS